jgi:TPP-dependent pyruvate/acetoin dehydrogenase alpha subunit
MWTVEALKGFEEQIAKDFEAGLIKAPVHLAGGNERHLISIFEHVKKEDYIACQWRSHFHALLKGVPAKEVRQAIHDGRSIALCFPEYRMISSAIVGGIAPIAMGIAWGIKRNALKGRVWCFLGDMTMRSGIVHETITYANNHHLPISFILEDNGMSVLTETDKVWGGPAEHAFRLSGGYTYKLTFPHVGTGKWVKF